MEKETITILREEHESLLRDSVKLAILTNYVKNQKYADSTIEAILEIPEEE